MLTKIRHGAEVDIPTQREIAQIIATAFDRQQSETYRRMKGSINLDGTGAGVERVRVNTQQYDALLERVTLTSGPNALFQFYENAQQGSDLLEVVQLGAAGLYSDSFSNNIYIPAGSQLFIAVTGGAANGQATYNLQIKLIKAVQ